jgi:transposase
MYKRIRSKSCKLSESKFRKILEYFSLDFTAQDSSKLLKINRHSVSRFYEYFRKIILEDSDESKVYGEVEFDESYFGPTRVKGKRGRGSSIKIVVFGVLKREGKVFTKVINNASRKEILPIIQEKILEDSTIYSDGWKAYDGLITEGFKHYRIHHHKNEFARDKNHINGIESFWAYVKLRLRKFKGVSKERFYVYLKESEWSPHSSLNPNP